MTADFERLAYEAALRSLDKQENYVEELRARAGVLLAASSLAVVSIATEVFILLPKPGLIFMQKGPGLYEDAFLLRDDMSELYRHLAYQLDRFWKAYDAKAQLLIRAFTLAATALVVEILALAILLGGNLLSS